MSDDDYLLNLKVNALSLTSTGRDLAVGAWQKVRIYDVSSGKDPKATIELPKNVTVVGFEVLIRKNRLKIH